MLICLMNYNKFPPLGGRLGGMEELRSWSESIVEGRKNIFWIKFDA